MSRGHVSRPHAVSSLRWRLSAAISGSIVVCAAVCVAGSVLFLRQTLTERMRNDLQRNVAGVSQYLGLQRTDLLGAAHLVAADTTVAADVMAGNPQALRVHLTPLYAGLSADVLDVIDARGRVLVRMEDPTAGDWVGGRPSMRMALQGGREVVALEADLPQREAGGGYAMRATVPLRSGARVIGAVVAGRLLNSFYATRIGGALDMDVNLIGGTQRTGTTLTDSQGLPATGLPEPAAVLARIARGQTSIATVQEDGRPVLSGLVPLLGADGRPAGAVEVVSPLGPLYDVIRELSLLLVALGAAVVGLGTLLALASGRGLTRRLLALEATAAHVAAMASAGESPGHMADAVIVRGHDEVASLARSFGAMIGALEERMAANARLYDAAQARVRELTGLAEIARLLTTTHSLQETLDALAERVYQLVGCSAVAIVMPNESADLALRGSYGLPDEYMKLINVALAARDGDELPLAMDMAMKTGEPASQQVALLPERYAELVTSAQAAGWHTATAVPLRVQHRIIGTLTCFTAPSHTLSDSDLSLLTTIADQVAVAVENARLLHEAQGKAALEERQRLARDLHDSVTQALFSTTLHARTAQIAMQREGVAPTGALGRSIAQLLVLTQGALAEMRALIFELRPSALREEGLVAALRKQAAALSAREGLIVEVQAADDRLDLPLAAEEHLYRLAQEALHNVVKHACATHALVRVEAQADGTVLVEVSDDGIGFDRTSVPAGHLGLGTMAERARQIRAGLEIMSTPGEGTTVRITVGAAAPREATVPAER